MIYKTQIFGTFLSAVGQKIWQRYQFEPLSDLTFIIKNAIWSNHDLFTSFHKNKNILHSHIIVYHISVCDDFEEK